MRLDRNSKVAIDWNATLDFDPTGSTVTLKVDAITYPAAWVGAPVVVGATWTRTARTTQLFAGPDAGTVGSPVVLTLGRHTAQPIVTAADGQVVACPPQYDSIDVR